MWDFIAKGASFAGVRNYVWLGVLVLIGALTAMIITIADNRDKRLIETAETAGASEAIIAGQTGVLNQVKEANDAEQEINRGDDAARFARCLRNATADTRANCDRFRPVPD
jgi:hypothetical protein